MQREHLYRLCDSETYHSVTVYMQKLHHKLGHALNIQYQDYYRLLLLYIILCYCRLFDTLV